MANYIWHEETSDNCMSPTINDFKNRLFLSGKLVRDVVVERVSFEGTSKETH